MGSDQAERIIRTGGPLKVWRREIEREGGDYITPVIDMLGVGDMETAMLKIIDQLEERFSAWGPAQYVKGFPEEHAPKTMKACAYLDAGSGLVVNVSSLVGGPHYTWSPWKGFYYYTHQILHYLLLLQAKIANIRIRVITNSGASVVSCHITSLDGVWEGDVGKEDVFDYAKVQSLFNRATSGGSRG